MTHTEWTGLQEACRVFLPLLLLVCAALIAVHIFRGVRLRWPTWSETGYGLSWLVVTFALVCWACWRWVGGE